MNTKVLPRNYRLEQKINRTFEQIARKENIQRKKTCFCCGSIQDVLFRIKECNFVYILERFIIKKLWEERYICILCHLILKKFHLFISKVEENLHKPHSSKDGNFISLAKSPVICVNSEEVEVKKEPKDEPAMEIEETQQTSSSEKEITLDCDEQVTNKVKETAIDIAANNMTPVNNKLENIKLNLKPTNNNLDVSNERDKTCSDKSQCNEELKDGVHQSPINKPVASNNLGDNIRVYSKPNQSNLEISRNFQEVCNLNKNTLQTNEIPKLNAVKRTPIIINKAMFNKTSMNKDEIIKALFNMGMIHSKKIKLITNLKHKPSEIYNETQETCRANDKALYNCNEEHVDKDKQNQINNSIVSNKLPEKIQLISKPIDSNFEISDDPLDISGFNKETLHNCENKIEDVQSSINNVLMNVENIKVISRPEDFNLETDRQQEKDDLQTPTTQMAPDNNKKDQIIKVISKPKHINLEINHETQVPSSLKDHTYNCKPIEELRQTAFIDVSCNNSNKKSDKIIKIISKPKDCNLEMNENQDASSDSGEQSLLKEVQKRPKKTPHYTQKKTYETFKVISIPKDKNLEISYEKQVVVVNITFEEFTKEREIGRNSEKYINFPYKCESCIVGFRYEHGLKSHMAKYHGVYKTGGMCSICKYTNASKASIATHMKNHFRRYECVKCGKRGPSYYDLYDHYIQEHTNQKYPYKCQICNFTTNKQSVIRNHRRRHKRRVHCSICYKDFVNSDTLKSHMRFIHEGVKGEFRCPKCDKQFRTHPGLKYHLNTHGGGQLYYCQECQTSYKSEGNYKVHLRKHSKHGAQRYECDYCGKNYSCKEILEGHISYDHLKIIQNKCSECSKVYKSKGGLRSHLRFAHQNKKLPKNKICEHCGAAFDGKSGLTEHIRTHTGERPLQCDECSATFKQSGALYTHKRLKHKKNKRKTNNFS